MFEANSFVNKTFSKFTINFLNHAIAYGYEMKSLKKTLKRSERKVSLSMVT